MVIIQKVKINDFDKNEGLEIKSKSIKVIYGYQGIT